MPMFGRRLSALHSQPLAVSRPLSGVVGVTLQQQRLASLFQLQGVDESALPLVTEALGFSSVPPVNTGFANDLYTLLWNGYQAWLLAARHESAEALRERIEGVASDKMTMIDLSHARCVLRVSGPCSVAMLASGVPIDIEGMRQGASAATLFTPFSIHLHCLQADCFDLYVFRSYGLALYEALQKAAVEYGFEALIET